jgi:hypothetical protein
MVLAPRPQFQVRREPLRAAAQDLRPARQAQNPRAIDNHHDAIRLAMNGVFQELGIAA